MGFEIAIHERKGSYSDRWIEYCEKHNVQYKIVNCFENTIISQLKNFQILLWNWELGSNKEKQCALKIITVAELMGLKVYPNASTCWHYDDKVAQKYLLESTELNFVPTYIFYELEEAFKWIDSTNFPKVFKLSCGAGSYNVRLVHSKQEAIKLASKAFGKGFKHFGFVNDTKTKLRKKRTFSEYFKVLQRLPITLKNIYQYNYLTGREKGYIYFQNFIPENDYDTRVTVIGDQAFAFIRKVRKRDFRASGSGTINYAPDLINMSCIKIAFEISKKLKTQSVACDFVENNHGEPLIIEISYSFQANAVFNCPGYWNQNLEWFEGHFYPQDLILCNLM